MSPTSLSPEEVICEMSISDLRELLGDLNIDASATMARRLKRLVREQGHLERAIETLLGPPTMRAGKKYRRAA